MQPEEATGKPRQSDDSGILPPEELFGYNMRELLAGWSKKQMGKILVYSRYGSEVRRAIGEDEIKDPQQHLKPGYNTANKTDLIGKWELSCEITETAEMSFDESFVFSCTEGFGAANDENFVKLTFLSQW